ncbi:MAG TPA: zinc ribbon domain-containing protein [Phycisphaerales bacterium]|nr:zinc ribbon domain-containing protein [Phycisphaerales bacterium]
MSVACPHCGTGNLESAEYCDSCGRAIRVKNTVPRVATGATFAATSAGRSLQSEELEKKAKSASTTLFVVAVLQTLGAVLFFVLGATGPAADKLAMQIGGGIMLVVACGFYGLGFWARKQPLPAAIVGTGILLCLWTLDIVMDPASALKGIIIKVIILIFLIRAIQAGFQHRKLKQQTAGGL